MYIHGGSMYIHGGSMYIHPQPPPSVAQERRQVLDKFERTTEPALIASSRALQEGVDLPALDMVIMITYMPIDIVGSAPPSAPLSNENASDTFSLKYTAGHLRNACKKKLKGKAETVVESLVRPDPPIQHKFLSSASVLTFSDQPENAFWVVPLQLLFACVTEATHLKRVEKNTRNERNYRMIRELREYLPENTEKQVSIGSALLSIGIHIGIHTRVPLRQGEARWRSPSAVSSQSLTRVAKASS
eukprot:509008-Pyramimonas_sp.AAC.1